jgi:hypothetical protein
MDALDLVLIGMVAILATALALMLLARLHDLRALRTHPDALAEERSKRRRLAAELHAARARIAELEHGQEVRRPELAGRFSRS